MTSYERLYMISKKRGLSPAKLLASMGIKGRFPHIAQLQTTHEIPSDVARLIAIYCDVSYEFVVGASDSLGDCDIDPKTFYETFLKMCSDKGKSPKDVAAELRYSRTAYPHTWAEYKKITPETACKFAKYFGVPERCFNAFVVLKRNVIKSKKPTMTKAEIWVITGTITRLCEEHDTNPCVMVQEVLGVSDDRWYNWVAGNSIPSLTQIKAIAEYFDVTIDSIVYGYDK